MSRADDDRFDGMYLNLAQQNQGIDNLLESFFGFLRRKTDFFTGVSEEKLEDAVLQVVRRQKAQSEKEELLRAKAKAEEEKKRAAKREAQAKKKAEQEEKKRKVQEVSRVEIAPKVGVEGGGGGEGVVEIGKDGTFDLGASDLTKVMTLTLTLSASVSALDSDGSVAAPVLCDGSAGAVQEEGKGNEGGESESKGEVSVPGEVGQDDDDDKTPPPEGNGGQTDNYVWTQTLQELSISVPVPEGIKSRDIVCDITKSKLRVGVRGKEMLIDGDMYNKVKVDDSFWTLEDGNEGKEISIALQKENQMEWWKCVIKGDPEINTSKVWS
ncbi:unnamed protein product [Choristocarpus tenellus]